MFTSNVAQAARSKARTAELVKILKQIHGAMPTPEEIKQHMQCAIHRDGTEEWKWRGKTILSEPNAVTVIASA